MIRLNLSRFNAIISIRCDFMKQMLHNTHRGGFCEGALMKVPASTREQPSTGGAGPRQEVAAPELSPLKSSLLTVLDGRPERASLVARQANASVICAGVMLG